MDHYSLVKTIHITTAVLSLAGFLLRGWWMISNNPLLNAKPVKIFPHINDTLLLGAAIYLSVVSGLYPFVESWLGAKVILLVVYIWLGTVALKRGKTRKTQIQAFVGALLSISIIFVMAIFKPSLY